MMNKRRWLFRIGMILLLVAVAACMMIIGRGHTVYFDNKTIEVNGQELKAYQRTDIYVNGERVARLAKRERGMATNIGQTFTFEADITENKGDEPVHHKETIKLPYGMDGIVLSLPAYFAGLPESDWRSEFVPQATTETEPEEVITDEFDMGEF